MKLGKQQRKEMLKRKEVLSKTRSTLKTEFIGLDDIIDEVMDILQSWYLFPNGQLRPTIINLWGMTGTGKTSLVKRISELLGMSNKLFKFDAGDYCSGELRLRYELSSKLKSHGKQPVIMAFDEFQLGRTVTEHGVEQDRNGLRAVWDLLDSGKFSVINDTYYANKLASVVIRLDECIRNGVEARNGVITKNKRFHNDIFYPEGRKKKTSNHKEDGADKELFVPEEFYYNVYHICEKEYINEATAASALMKMDEKQTIEFLYKIVEKGIEPVEHDFSQALIFTIGNIDEAYAMSDNVDPDFDADIFYKHSLKITVTEIKNALLKRFRAEQIARLGNNFIIYPAFSSDSYARLVNMELNRVCETVLNNFEICLKFDHSIADIIYKEGVFPTQGTRPIFTTINSLIESYVCRVIAFVAENNPDTNEIKWSYSDGKYIVDFLDKNGSRVTTETYPIKLKIENLRKPLLDEKQANTAVHESGHAVLSSLIMGIIPDEIVSMTAGMNHGFCRTEVPEFRTKSFYEKDIVTSFGGYAAEILVFGEDNITGGSYSDIEHATHLAVECFRSMGMGGVPGKVSAPDVSMNSNAMFSYEESDKMTRKFLLSCKEKATKCLKDNMLLLLKLSEYLSVNAKMNKEQIREYVIKYNSYGVSSFKSKDDYYGFRKMLKDKLVKHKG